MPRQPEIGNVALYPNRPLRKSDRNGYQLKFYCPIRKTRIRKNCGTRDRREARKIQRECQERLINGEYLVSGGAITKDQEERQTAATFVPQTSEITDEMTWEAAYEQYRDQAKRRQRRKSTQDSFSRIDIAGRIFEARRAEAGLPPGATLKECMTLSAMEYLQGELLDGAECRYAFRSPNTVNSMMGAIMAFVRYCKDHEWIDRVPPLKKLEVDEVMRGRPISEKEFLRMLDAVPQVVGETATDSWQFALRLLWESGFRIGDMMNFSWDDEKRIHPIWPSRSDVHPTIKIPSSQKNRKVEEIPMLPALKALLDEVDDKHRVGFVVNPMPIEYEMKSERKWFMPNPDDLQSLIQDYSKVAIGKACGVSDVTVGKWISKLGLSQPGENPMLWPGGAERAGRTDAKSIWATNRSAFQEAIESPEGQRNHLCNRPDSRCRRSGVRRRNRTANQIRQCPRPSSQSRRTLDQLRCLGRNPDGCNEAQGFRHNEEVLRSHSCGSIRRQRDSPKNRRRHRLYGISGGITRGIKNRPLLSLQRAVFVSDCHF